MISTWACRGGCFASCWRAVCSPSANDSPIIPVAKVANRLGLCPRCTAVGVRGRSGVALQGGCTEPGRSLWRAMTVIDSSNLWILLLFPFALMGARCTSDKASTRKSGQPLILFSIGWCSALSIYPFKKIDGDGIRLCACVGVPLVARWFLQVS